MIKLNDYKRMYNEYSDHNIARLGTDRECFVCDWGFHPFLYDAGHCYLCRTCNTYLEFMCKNKDRDKEIFAVGRLDSNRDLALFKMKLLNSISLTNKKGATKNALKLISNFIDETPLNYKVLNAAALCLYTVTTHASLSTGAVSNVFIYAEHAKFISIEELEMYRDKISIL